MKRLLIAITVLLALTLSGCSSEDVYTQEEIDVMFDDFEAMFDDFEEEVGEAFNDELPEIYYTENEIDVITQDIYDSFESNDSYIASRYVTNESWNNMENELEDELEELYGRIEELEDKETYNREQIEYIVYAYELQNSIITIQNFALDEGRELTSEEDLLIASLELLLNNVNNMIEEVE